MDSGSSSSASTGARVSTTRRPRVESSATSASKTTWRETRLTTSPRSSMLGADVVLQPLLGERVEQLLADALEAVDLDLRGGVLALLALAGRSARVALATSACSLGFTSGASAAGATGAVIAVPGSSRMRARAVQDRGRLAEPGRQARLERVELLLVHLAHREHHDEQHHQQGHHVGVRDQPAFVVLVLLLVDLASFLWRHVRPPAACSAAADEQRAQLLGDDARVGAGLDGGDALDGDLHAGRPRARRAA